MHWAQKGSNTNTILFYSRWEKRADSAGDYIDRRTYVCTFRNVSSVVIVYFVVMIKSYTKFLK